MPRGDRMGSAGMGPMSGRAAGHCAGFDGPGFANPGPGRGRGRGFGRGRGGFGRRFGGFRLGAQLRAIESRLAGGEKTEGAE